MRIFDSVDRGGAMMRGVRRIDLPSHGDDRGSLVAIESGRHVPFDVKRVYYIFGTQNDVSRGFHAHLELKQLLVCVSGSCSLVIDDGHERQSFRLDSPESGILIEGLLWREMHDFSSDCVLLVLASEHYDERDYIRDYTDFKAQVDR